MPEVQRIHVTLTRDQNVAPSVAAYVIFRTEAAGVDQAIDYMFERREADNRYQHPYFGYLPAGASLEPQEEEKKQLVDDDDELQDELGAAIDDLELGENNRSARAKDNQKVGNWGRNEVCFICGGTAAEHDLLLR